MTPTHFGKFCLYVPDYLAGTHRKEFERFSALDFFFLPRFSYTMTATRYAAAAAVGEKRIADKMDRIALLGIANLFCVNAIAWLW